MNRKMTLNKHTAYIISMAIIIGYFLILAVLNIFEETVRSGISKPLDFFSVFLLLSAFQVFAIKIIVEKTYIKNSKIPAFANVLPYYIFATIPAVYAIINFILSGVFWESVVLLLFSFPVLKFTRSKIESVK